MLIYTISLCAVVAVTFLIQLQAYSHYHGGDAGTDVSPITGLPIEHAFGYELVVEEQVSALT
jgi:hypothetical protein